MFSGVLEKFRKKTDLNGFNSGVLKPLVWFDARQFWTAEEFMHEYTWTLHLLTLFPRAQ